MTPVVEPDPGSPYTGLIRHRPLNLVAPLGALVVGLLGYAVGVAALSGLVLAIGWVARGRPGDFAAYQARALAFEYPEGMLAAHLGLGVLIVLTLLALRLAAGLRPRWVASVQPGFRWRYAVLVLVAAAVIVNASVWLTRLGHLGPAHPQPGFAAFMIVMVLTSPLQAAGEEFLFRGLLLTALGSLVGHRWFGIGASALLFALAHGVQSPPLFLDRLAFGLLAGALVVATGGLEAGIAAHVANNLFAWTYAGLFSTMAATRAIHTLSWGDAAVDVVTFALIAAAAWAIGRGLRVATRTPGPELASGREVR